MMVQEQVIENLKMILREHGRNENIEINDMTNLLDELHIDSIGMIEIVCEIETQFGIFFDGDDLDIENLRTFVGISSVVLNKLNFQGC